MSRIDIAGAGAFGTALAIALAREGHDIRLWARHGAAQMQARRENSARLPDIALPARVSVTDDLTLLDADILLLAVPTQALGGFLDGFAPKARYLVSCAKGIDLRTGLGPARLIARHCPKSHTAQLTGPSFAQDIAGGLPTALTIATAQDEAATFLQSSLSTAHLRLYRSTDVIGAELGGALKNVIAIAAGAVIGAGLGQSARAALIARGFAEMRRVAQSMGGQAETLAGLSGLGDLVLTCTSEKSRNMRYGMSLTQGTAWPEDVTVEGRATALGIRDMAQIDTPICDAVAALCERLITFDEALDALLTRPLTKE